MSRPLPRTPITEEIFTLTSPSANGGAARDKVRRGNIVRWLGFELSFQLQCSAGNNIIANILRGDELAALEELTIKADGSIVWTGSGDDLWWDAYEAFDALPPVSLTLGNGVADPTVKVNLVLPMILPGSVRPFDTAFDTTRFVNTTVEAKFAKFDQIIAAASGYLSLPTLKLYQHEGFHTPEPEDDPQFDSRRNKLTRTCDAANKRFQFPLERFPGFYHGFHVRTTTGTPNADTAGCINSVRLKRGNDVVFELSESQWRESQQQYSRRNAPIEKLNIGVASLVNNTTGTSDGTVADVGGAFSQATLNNNFADLAVKVNAILDQLNGRPRKHVPRLSPKSDPTAHNYITLPSDGFLRESLWTGSGGDPMLEFDVATPCTIDVRPRMLRYIEGRKA